MEPESKETKLLCGTVAGALSLRFHGSGAKIISFYLFICTLLYSQCGGYQVGRGFSDNRLYMTRIKV